MRKLVTFGRILREAGLEVGPGRLQDGLRALDSVRLDDRDEVYHALRCAIVSRHDDLEAFDAAFATFWERAPRAELTHRPPLMQLDVPAPHGADARGVDAHQVESERATPTRRATRTSCRSPPCSRPTSCCASATSRASARTSSAVPARSSSGSPSPRRRGDRCATAPRTTVAASTCAGRCTRRCARAGTHRAGLADAEDRPRRLIFLVDVSGSMEPYARAMTMFLEAAVRSGRHVEAFTFGTRLTRLTPYLIGRDPDRALGRAARRCPTGPGAPGSART